MSTRLREQGVLQRLCRQPCLQNLQHDAGRGRVDKTAGTGVSAKTVWAAVLGKLLYGSAVKLLRRRKKQKSRFQQKNPQTAALNPAPGAALKCFLLVSCFGADYIQSKMLTFSKNLAWRICRPRKVEPSKNGYGEGGPGQGSYLPRRWGSAS